VKDLIKVLCFASLVIIVTGIPLMASDYCSDQVIVKFKSRNPQSAQAMSVEEERPMAIAVDDVQKAIKDMKESGDVEYVEPNYVIEADAVPSDWPYVGEWSSMGIVNAWNLIDTHGAGKQVIIAVIDSGVDLTHPDLQSVLMPGYDFANKDATPEDDSGHGTKVCGIIGAKGNNGSGIAGVDLDVNIAIMPVKFMKMNNGSTTGSLADAVSAIYYAVDNGASVINASWGFDSYSQSLSDAINYAKSHGVLFVTSAGNSGEDNDTTNHYPSNYQIDNIIAVAAMNMDGSLASFSNYGVKNVHIAAPGVGITSTTLNGGIVYGASGTSFAAPFVTSVAAMVISQSSNVNYSLARSIILNTVAKGTSLAVSSGGSLNAYGALLAEEGYDASAQATPATDSPAVSTAESGGGGGGGGCLINVVQTTGNYSGFIIIMIVIALFQVRRRKDLE
jgi:subtilisin family serine protease